MLLNTLKKLDIKVFEIILPCYLCNYGVDYGEFGLLSFIRHMKMHGSEPFEGIKCFEMFRKNESNQCDRGGVGDKKDIKTPWTKGSEIQAAAQSHGAAKDSQIQHRLLQIPSPIVL